MYTIRGLVVFSILLCSLLIPNIAIMLSIVGNITGTLISVVFPVIVFNKAYEKSEKKQRQIILNWVFMVMGLICGSIGFAVTVNEII